MALAPAASALAVLLKGLSPICSSMTSLPAALSFLATARTSNAVSVDKPRANALRATEVVIVLVFITKKIIGNGAKGERKNRDAAGEPW
jgi:hypothetical protein